MEKKTRAFLFAVLTIALLLATQISAAAAKPLAYTPLVLGTFGDQGSSLRDIDDQGKVVGVWVDTVLGRNAFVWSPATGKINLAALPGQTMSSAICINNMGQIAGFSGIALFNHVVLWTPENTVTELNPVVLGQPRGINEAGQVVGFTEIEFYVGLQRFLLPDRAFIWTAETDIAYIPMPVDVHASLASDINNNGQVVGYTLIDNADGVHIDYRAFKWTAEEGTEFLAVPEGATVTAATDVNDKGEIVGYYERDDVRHAVMWKKNGKIVDLETLPSIESSIAAEINEKGQIVGTCYTPTVHACLWTISRSMIVIGGPSGATSCMAMAINSKGQIAGSSFISGLNQATIWYP